MAEENISQEFRLKNIDETRNYSVEEINRNKLISKNPKKVCTTLSYIEQFLILGLDVFPYLPFLLYLVFQLELLVLELD